MSQPKSNAIPSLRGANARYTTIWQIDIMFGVVTWEAEDRARIESGTKSTLRILQAFRVYYLNQRWNVRPGCERESAAVILSVPRVWHTTQLEYIVPADSSCIGVVIRKSIWGYLQCPEAYPTGLRLLYSSDKLICFQGDVYVDTVIALG